MIGKKRIACVNLKSVLYSVTGSHFHSIFGCDERDRNRVTRDSKAAAVVAILVSFFFSFFYRRDVTPEASPIYIINKVYLEIIVARPGVVLTP